MKSKAQIKEDQEIAKAVKRVKDMQKFWEELHPFEMKMSREAVELALPKQTRDILDRQGNSRENLRALVKFFKQVDGLK